MCNLYSHKFNLSAIADLVGTLRNGGLVCVPVDRLVPGSDCAYPKIFAWKVLKRFLAVPKSPSVEASARRQSVAGTLRRGL